MHARCACVKTPVGPLPGHPRRGTLQRKEDCSAACALSTCQNSGGTLARVPQAGDNAANIRNPPHPGFSMHARCMRLKSGGTLARATTRGTHRRLDHDEIPACLMSSGYVGEFEVIDDHRSGKVVVELIGRINKCGVISPRFDVGIYGIEQWTQNLLPSRQFGYIVMTTSLGIMDHEEVIFSPCCPFAIRIYLPIWNACAFPHHITTMPTFSHVLD
jgi:small subunit ribosomal protein S15Ae